MYDALREHHVVESSGHAIYLRTNFLNGISTSLGPSTMGGDANDSG